MIKYLHTYLFLICAEVRQLHSDEYPRPVSGADDLTSVPTVAWEIFPSLPRSTDRHAQSSSNVPFPSVELPHEHHPAFCSPTLNTAFIQAFLKQHLFQL